MLTLGTLDLCASSTAWATSVLAIAIGAATAATYAIALQRIVRQRHLGARVEQARTHLDSQEFAQRFRTALLKGLRDGIVSTPQDAEQVFVGARPPSVPDISLSYDLEFALQILLVDLLAGAEQPVDAEQAEADRQSASKIKSLIEELQTEMPFTSVPESERMLLTDALQYSRNSQPELVQERLEQLAASIRTRAEDVDELKSTSRMSLALAILGLLATILMGFLTFSIR